MKNILISAVTGLFFGLMGAGVFFYHLSPVEPNGELYQTVKYRNGEIPLVRNQEIKRAVADNTSPVSFATDFTEASYKSTSSVVYIQTSSEVARRGMADWFFEPRSRTRVGSGSGVIMTGNGYIVTNNHVIDGADVIKVIHGRNSYDGVLVGTDPSTDIAVIKIEETNMPAISLGDSEGVQVGEWVLAVGNPFNLESTVTAGIVSAKGRNINILRDKFPIESFIQTDAAINPGNSGGALVNVKGELIGINTAILSQTGSYAGYGFAVPVDIVKKVFDDIKTYGQVQKAFIGADYLDIDSELAGRLGTNDVSGVIIANVQDGSSADRAKLIKGDIIREVNGREVSTKGQLEEIIGNSYPGDKLNVTVERSGKLLDRTITLTNKEGTTALLKDNRYYSDQLGATFIVAPKVERDLYGIKAGLKVVDFDKNGLFSRLDIRKNYIITYVNGEPIDSPKEFEDIIMNASGFVNISVITENGRRVRYPYRF